jgi:hypothetical protein
MRLALSGAAMSVLAAVSGCVSINEGEVSYRRAEPRSSYHVDAPPPSDGPQHPVLITPLVRQNLSQASQGHPVQAIVAGTQLSIRLDHAFVDGSMSEIPFTADRLMNGSNPFIQRGEFVILANAFEFPAPSENADEPPAAGGDNAATPPVANAPAPGTGPQFHFDNASLSNARVVFYSNDVQSGQSLNFSNIPIPLMGPSEYHGRPIGIQLIILELDDTSEQMESLLTQLADLGKSAAGLDGPLGNALLSLGRSLISGSSDDTLFRYTMVLDAQTTAGSPSVPVLEPGRMVFFRREHRGDPVNWSELRLDDNDGRLYRFDRTICTATAATPVPAVTPGRTDDETRAAEARRAEAIRAAETVALIADSRRTACYVPFQNETYFTVNVIDHGPTAPPIQYNYTTLEQLRTAMTGPARAPTATLVTELQRDADTYRAQQRQRDLVRSWRSVRDVYASRYAPLLREGVQGVTDQNICPGDPTDLAARTTAARFEAHIAAREFWRAAKEAFSDDKFMDANRQAVLSEFSDFGLADDQQGGVTPDELDPAQFKTTFLDPASASVLIERLDRAAARLHIERCPAVETPPS